jgi:Secretion system C-terminal sorting domain
MKTQRKTLTVLITMICVLAMKGLFAQSVTYDCTPAGWSTVGSQVTIGPTTANFVGAADGTIPRFVHRDLPWTLNELAWSCDFEFTAISGSGPFHALVAFTEAEAPRLNSSGDNTIAPMDFSNTNCIAVCISAPLGNTNPANWTVYARAKKRVSPPAYGYTLLTSPTWSNSAPITVGGPVATPRYMRIQRLDNTRCKLTMFTTAARTTEVSSTCFTIPGGTYYLRNVQVGNCPEGAAVRTFTGTVDNISVFNMNPQLTGLTTVCAGTPSNFILSNGNDALTGSGFPGSTGFTWTASGGGVLLNGTVGATYISGTGRGSQNNITFATPGVKIITCTVNYGCASVTYTINVMVSLPPTAIFTAQPAYCFGAPILVDGTGSNYETNYFWTATPCDEDGAATGPGLTSPYLSGTAGVYDLTPILALPPGATCTLYYKIFLTTANPGCGSVSSSTTIIQINQPPSFTVTSSDLLLCPDEDCTTMSAISPCPDITTYTWLPAAGVGCTDCANTTACPDITTTYTITASTPGCFPIAKMITIEVSTLNVNAGPDFTMCCGDIYTMAPIVSGGTPPYSYEWSPATGLSCTDCPTPTVSICNSAFPPPTIITYTLTVTDADSCIDSDIVSITVLPCRLAGNQNNQSEEDATSEQISVFPNPASQVIQITTGSYTASKIEITDLAGRVVLSTKPQSNKVELKIADLPEGSYLVRIETLSGIETREIIVTH